MTEHDAREARRVAMSSRRGSRYNPRRRAVSHRHLVAKIITSTLLVLALATSVSVVAVYNHLNGNIDVVEVDKQLKGRPEAGPEGPLNVLVMGSDSRAGDNNIDNKAGGGARSDTTVLLHLSADRKRAYGVSIPRDTLVDRPTCYKENGEEIPGAKDVIWNDAFSVGGPACTIQQVEQLSQVRIDNYVVIDFQGFKDMVNALGGVEVCIPEDINDEEHNITLKAGTREIQGDEALSYVRVRNVGDGTDPQRIKRQQAFMAAMIGKVISGGMLARPDKMVSFLDAATKSLQTDVESISALAKLAGEFESAGLDSIKFVTTPWVYSTRQEGRVEWKPSVNKLWQLIREDEKLSSQFVGESISAADDPDGSTTKPGEESSEKSTGPTNKSDDGLSEEEREAAGLCA